MYDLSFHEYKLLLKTLELRWTDEDHRQHREAFLNFAVQATEKDGRPVYRDFKDWYDYEAALNKKQKSKAKNDPISRLEEYYRSKKNGR